MVIKILKLNVYGKLIEITRQDSKWMVFYLGNEGKKRRAADILIPDHIPEQELSHFIADLCHEWAKPGNNDVRVLNN